MSNIYIETAETIKGVMNVGFDFTQALRIHRLVDSSKTILPEINKEVNETYEDLGFVGELFNLGTGETSATAAYKAYCNWAIDNGSEMMNQSTFGVKLSKVVDKKRTSQGIVYLMEVIE